MSALVPRETWGELPLRGSALRIGLSFDQGTPKYRLYLGAMLAAAECAGIRVDVPWLAGVDRPFDRLATRALDGLILTGGADVEPGRYRYTDVNGDCKMWPGRDEIELAILDAAISRRIPILAICRGMQLINVARGGTLIPEIEKAQTHQLSDARRHTVEIEPGSMLHRVVKCRSGEVTSSHHQAVGSLGRGLRACAQHADGTLEGIEWADPMRKPWLLGVQWHPERMALDEPLAGPIYAAFLDAVNARRA